MHFDANKTPVEVIREGAFGETYFRDLYSGINGKWYRKSLKEFDQLKDIDQKNWINEIDPYGWFQWYFRYWLGRRLEDDERQINRWIKVVSRFRGKLVKMIKHAGSKYDDYSILRKIRQVLLHWGYEFTEKDIFINSTN